MAKEWSDGMGNYFESLSRDVKKEFDLALEARKKGFDPEKGVSVRLAKNMAERVIGLISVIAPQIENSGADKRIQDLEKEYGVLDWRVAFIIAEEIAREKFCKFSNKVEAIEIGIRTGFAYVTLGVVSAPLEGFTHLEIKKRNDGTGEYFCLHYAGPIRNAGGTAAAVSVLIADYVRLKFGYLPYDPTEKEVQRCPAEIEDYHNYVTNLQYFPSKIESEFIMEHLPVEINGDPSEKREISNFNLKDLPRVSTNKIRSGYCLIHSSCIPLKAPKLWAKLEKWGKEFDMGQWDFLKEFIAIQKKAKAKGAKGKETTGIKPDFTYIKDLVAGRPVLGHPLVNGGFRLRYGRTRTSGYSAQSMHPSTMHVLQDYVAQGTQLKVERPGKAAAYSTCEVLKGPIVKLKNGDVKELSTEELGIKYKDDVEEIIYSGDILVNYGDFFDRAHPLVPSGYCEEWWVQELKKAATDLGKSKDLESDLLKKFVTRIFWHQPTYEEAESISKTYGIPLFPGYTFFWKSISADDARKLRAWLKKGRLRSVFTVEQGAEKRFLELVGVPHSVVNKDYVVVEQPYASALVGQLALNEEANGGIEQDGFSTGLELVQALSLLPIRDMCGTFVGARMGRPEKAKMRKLTGSPHCLFPVGDEGGRLRSFQAALEKGKITSNFPIYSCTQCSKETVFSVCEICGSETVRKKHCSTCGVVEDCSHEAQTYRKSTIRIGAIFRNLLSKMKTRIYPDLIKGVRGTSNKDHTPEHLIKGILRAKHDIAVNKDGTTRYDCSESPITHFKPGEVGAEVERLLLMGYTHDIKGDALIDPEQILELKPQDIIVPCCPDSPDEAADEILFRTTKFIDELLGTLYGLPGFYNLEEKKELIGQYVVGLAPHTSAGIVGRIAGFSKTQCFYAHPLYHAAMRRDCFTFDTFIPLKSKNGWSLNKIGDVVDELNPVDVVDDFGTKEITVKGYKTIGVKNGKVCEVPINNFTKHAPRPIIKIKTKLGRIIKTTPDHKHVVVTSSKDVIKKAYELKEGDHLKVPYNLNIIKKDVSELNLLELFKENEWVMVHGLKNQIHSFRKKLSFLKLTRTQINNYVNRDSLPLPYATLLLKQEKVDKKKLFISAKRDSVMLPAVLEVNERFLKILGLYVAEGYSRKKMVGKGYYQVYIAAEKKEIREFIKAYFESDLGLKPSENKKDRVTYSSRIIYDLFTNHFSMGSSAYEKRMPRPFLNLPNKKLGWLLSGYFEGDGSVTKNDLRITFDTVSPGLMRDIEFILGQLNVFVKYKSYTKEPGDKLKEFYFKKLRKVPLFTCTKGTIQSKFMKLMFGFVSFISQEKQNRFRNLVNNKKFRNLFLKYDEHYFFDKIISISILSPEVTYCLNTENNFVVANGLLTKQCDGDESCFFLLMDAFLNFSSSYLPSSRGSTMDAPLVLTSVLNAAEVDDMAFHVDTAWEYPLELYEAAQEFKNPWDVQIPLLKDYLGTPKQYEGIGYTHPVFNINAGVLCSAYKLLPSMQEKLGGQMELAEKIRAVDPVDVARLVIEKHFIRDIKGNLRKFSMQIFRCVHCNEKFRRPPLIGRCTKCGGKIIFTISEGSIVKYLEPSLSLARKYHVSDYLQQSIELTKRRIEVFFGKDKEVQEGLGKWFG